MFSGYPYYAGVNFHIGAGKVLGRPLDASLMLRSYFTRTTLSIRGRMNIAHRKPFSAAVFTEIGGGGTLFDDSGRNTVFLNGGLIASLTALGRVSISTHGTD